MKKILILSFVIFLGACAAQPNKPPITKKIIKVLKVIKPKPAPKPMVTAAQVLQKNTDWLLQIWGKPSFSRTDQHASIWQYKNKKCILNLFLYPASKTDPTKIILHFDARSLDGHNTDRTACLNTF